MKNEVALKIYKVDYDFIVKNYLSPAMWEKTWTLFVYRDIQITLNIDYISVRPKKICFNISIRQDEEKCSINIWHNIDSSNYNILKKQINSAIECLIESLERQHIYDEDGYKQIQEAGYKEDDLLKDIANDFLDENGVSNKEIRDIYVYNYISNNKKTDTYLSNYVTGRKHRCMPDLWMVYYKATENNEKYQELLNKLSNELSFNEMFKNIQEAISVFDEDMKDTDMYNDYVYDIQQELESI